MFIGISDYIRPNSREFEHCFCLLKIEPFIASQECEAIIIQRDIVILLFESSAIF